MIFIADIFACISLHWPYLKCILKNINLVIKLIDLVTEDVVYHFKLSIIPLFIQNIHLLQIVFKSVGIAKNPLIR